MKIADRKLEASVFWEEQKFTAHRLTRSGGGEKPYSDEKIKKND